MPGSEQPLQRLLEAIGGEQEACGDGPEAAQARLLAESVRPRARDAHQDVGGREEQYDRNEWRDDRQVRVALRRELVVGPAPVAEEVAQLVQRERPAGEEGCGPGPPAPRGHGPDGTPKSQRSMKAAELDERAMRSGTPSAPIARTEIT